MEIKIGNKIIGEKHRCFIIAEAGINHNGDINLAKKMIDIASDAEVDAVKFQTFKTEGVMIRTRPKAEYQKNSTNPDENFFDMSKKLEFPFEYFIDLKSYCESKGLIFLSTPFCFESVNFLGNLGVDAFKISSGDIVNYPFLSYIMKYNKAILFSSGTADFKEVKETVDFFKENNYDKIILFQCTTAYPTPYENVNLKVISSFKKAFPDVIIGFSDHSLGPLLGSAAVALGIDIIEKHFTLDQNFEGPDHQASLNPKELIEYVRNIRITELALGDSDKKIQDIEKSVKLIARKSVVSKTDILKGTILTENDITIKRPGTGIQPKFFNNLIGKKINKFIKEDTIIKWDDIIG